MQEAHDCFAYRKMIPVLGQSSHGLQWSCLREAAKVPLEGKRSESHLLLHRL